MRSAISRRSMWAGTSGGSRAASGQSGQDPPHHLRRGKPAAERGPGAGCRRQRAWASCPASLATHDRPSRRPSNSSPTVSRPSRRPSRAPTRFGGRHGLARGALSVRRSPGRRRHHAQEAFEAAQHLQSSAAALALQAFGSRLSQSELRAARFRAAPAGSRTAAHPTRRHAGLRHHRPARDERQRRAGDQGQDRRSRTAVPSAERRASRQAGRARRSDARQVDPFHAGPLVPGGDEALISIVPGDDRPMPSPRPGRRCSGSRRQSSRMPSKGWWRHCAAASTLSQWAGSEGFARCSGLAGNPKRINLLPFNVAVAHELYANLLAPFETMIAGKHLLMSLSGPLATLPPHLLVTARPETATPQSREEYARTAWLGRRHAVTILPSIAGWASLRAPRSDRMDRRAARRERTLVWAIPSLPGIHCASR